MARFSISLTGLNEAQRHAVATDSGPLLVLAGAGTGKTRVVTVRIARLISQGVEPQRILAVTFTNKAAAEMQTRVAALLPRKSSARPHVSTFHSYCVGVLRRNIQRLGYPSRFVIYATGPQRSIAQRVLREAKLPSTSLRPDDLLRLISYWKSDGLSPDEAAASASSDREHLAAVGFRRYQQTMLALGAVDFDDLLLLTQKLFQQFPQVRRAEAGQFDHVLIDEYQDTNQSQYRIVRWLAARHRNLCVVGDDDQSIYGWRGAQVTHILNFRKDWPEAKVVRLEQNYRSATPILECANRLIRRNRQRYPKTLRSTQGSGRNPQVCTFDDEDAEARHIVEQVASLLDTRRFQPQEIAILFRTNEQPRPFEQQLRRQQVPYRLIGGTSFFDRREVKDAISYLRMLCDPEDDTALVRVINRPARGVSPSVITALRQRAAAQSCSVWSLVQRQDLPPDLSAAAARAVVQFVRQMEAFAGRLTAEGPSQLARAMFKQMDYQREIEVMTNDADDRNRRWQTVLDLLADLRQQERSNRQLGLSDYLNELVLRDRDFEPTRDEESNVNAVRLMTLHAAKGLEFPVVFLVGMEEGILPHRKSVSDAGTGIEEERRLCYVGVTRARKALTISMARERMRRGRPVLSHPSRFLYELFGKTDHPDYQMAMQFLDQRRTSRRRAGRPNRQNR